MAFEQNAGRTDFTERNLSIILHINRSNQWIYVQFVDALIKDGHMSVAPTLMDDGLLPLTADQCVQLEECIQMLLTVSPTVDVKRFLSTASSRAIIERPLTQMVRNFM